MTEDKSIKFFTQIPAWVDELDNISDFQARLIGYIYTFENITGAAFPSNQNIAKRFNKSIKTVQTALSDLYNKGIIESVLIYKQDSKIIDKRFLKIKYVPTPKNEGTLPPKTSIPYTQKRGEGTPENGVDNILINKSMNKLINNASIDEDFEKVWAIYPKKAGKSNAKKAFDKAIKSGVSIELIKQKIGEYNQQIAFKKTDRQYIKNGSTWFNQAGWEDEYETGNPVKSTKVARVTSDPVQFNNRYDTVKDQYIKKFGYGDMPLPTMMPAPDNTHAWELLMAGDDELLNKLKEVVERNV